MSEQTLIRINAQLCNEKGCSDVNLNLSQSEAFKVYQSVASSKVEILDYSQYMQFWGISFSATLSLWLTAFVGGRILRFFR
uniref:Uncharacterized protein n=1 Tax=Dulem virus 53 TaxID=3145764 RepID=A0AAU8B2P3_9VIRU